MICEDRNNQYRAWIAPTDYFVCKKPIECNLAVTTPISAVETGFQFYFPRWKVSVKANGRRFVCIMRFTDMYNDVIDFSTEFGIKNEYWNKFKVSDAIDCIISSIIRLEIDQALKTKCIQIETGEYRVH